MLSTRVYHWAVGGWLGSNSRETNKRPSLFLPFTSISLFLAFASSRLKTEHSLRHPVCGRHHMTLLGPMCSYLRGSIVIRSSRLSGSPIPVHFRCLRGAQALTTSIESSRATSRHSIVLVKCRKRAVGAYTPCMTFSFGLLHTHAYVWMCATNESPRWNVPLPPTPLHHNGRLYGLPSHPNPPSHLDLCPFFLISLSYSSTLIVFHTPMSARARFTTMQAWVPSLAILSPRLHPILYQR